MLERAIAVTKQLRAALAAEVEGARNERKLLKSLDARALFARATERATFNAYVARLERELADALAAVAHSCHLGEVTLSRLAEKAPEETAGLARALDDVRALAAALKELDQLNVFLASRALACVRGYVSAVSPAPTAYDRRGLRAQAPVAVVVSSKG